MLLVDWIRQPPPPDYSIVAGATALDDWQLPGLADRREGSPDAVADLADNAGAPTRWIVVGWDGATWDLALPLIEQGRLPNLESLMRRGSVANLGGFRPSLSPVLWTTVATGVSPERHGILGFDKRSHRVWRRLERIARFGKIKRELYTNADRKVPALWNLATEAGRPVLVVGYHNTYPAEQVQGAMVSNYLLQAYMREAMRANRELPPELRNSLVSPPEIAEAVLAVEERVGARLPAAIERFADFDAAGREVFPEASLTLSGGDHRMYFLRQAWLFDTFHAEVALELYPQFQPELTFVHFQGVDLASHYFLPFRWPERYAEMGWLPDTVAEMQRLQPIYRRTVDAFYEYLDEWLGRLLALADERTGVVVLSDHGAEPEPDPHRGGHHDSAPPGILVVAGPGVRAGGRLSQATLYDIMPTLARTLGLPIAADLDGRVLEELFDPGALASIERIDVPHYADGRWAPRIAPPPELVDEIEEQLRSLGYVD